MNPWLLREVVYPAYRLVKHDRVRHFSDEFGRTQWLNTAEVLDYQWKKLLSMLEHAGENVPYYRSLFDGAGFKTSHLNSPDDLKLIPPLSKDAIRENSEALISRTVPRDDLKKDSTGGSTGDRIWFYEDQNCLDARRAILLRGNAWAGAEPGDRTATLWGAEFDLMPHRRCLGKLKCSILNAYFLSSYNLNDRTMAEYAQFLEALRPKLLTSYPTPLAVFAEFLEQNPKWTVKPGSVITSAETLFDHQRELIERVFSCKVFDRYGSREFGNMAQECSEHHGMHINAERVFMEIVREDGHPAQPGEPGELLITDLDNYGMPLIRYRIGDIAVPSEALCPCGRGLPLLERVEGRVFDVIVSSSGAKYPGTFWTFLTRAVAGVYRFQVVQREPGHVAFKIVPGPEFARDSLSRMEVLLAEHTGGEITADFEVVESIPLTRSGKHRFVISELGREVANPPSPQK